MWILCTRHWDAFHPERGGKLFGLSCMWAANGIYLYSGGMDNGQGSRYIHALCSFWRSIRWPLSVFVANNGKKFGASPPFFVPEREGWGSELASAQMPMVVAVPHCKRLSSMCTASLLYHKNFVLQSLPLNHVIRSSHMFRNAGVLAQMDGDDKPVVVMYPWEDSGHVFSGIPPHTVLLQEMERLQAQQQTLVETFVDKVRTAIDESGLSGNGVTEGRLRNLFDGFAESLRDQLSNLSVQDTRQERERVETNTGYQWHYYDGKIHRVPKDWRFLRVGVLDCWRQWWIGDTV